MSAAVNGPHAALTKTFFNAIFSGQSLTEQGIICLLERNAISRTQGGCVRIF
jgi:hypothetical protein